MVEVPASGTPCDLPKTYPLRLVVWRSGQYLAAVVALLVTCLSPCSDVRRTVLRARGLLVVDALSVIVCDSFVPNSCLPTLKC